MAPQVINDRKWVPVCHVETPRPFISPPPTQLPYMGIRGGSRIPRSPPEGAPSLQGAPTYDFAKFANKNCMKLRTFWAVGGALGAQ